MIVSGLSSSLSSGKPRDMLFFEKNEIESMKKMLSKTSANFS